MTLFVLLIVGGVALLYAGAEGLVRGAARLGARLGVSPIIVGLTVVSMGTSAPELVVCILAALRDNGDLAVGNVLGSNLANVGLILGLAAVVKPLEVANPVLRRDIPWMLAITLLVLPLMLNSMVGRVEGLILAAALTVYLIHLVRVARAEGAEALTGTTVDPKLVGVDLDVAEPGVGRPVAFVVAGSLALTAGGHAVVTGAAAVAEVLGIPQLLIGLSVVAVGTSLPELAATMVAAVRREADLAVGNIVGSNIFNLTLVLGGTALVRPIAIPLEVLVVDYPAVLLLSLILLPLAGNQKEVGRGEGLFLILLYGTAWVWIGTELLR